MLLNGKYCVIQSLLIENSRTFSHLQQLEVSVDIRNAARKSPHNLTSPIWTWFLFPVLVSLSPASAFSHQEVRDIQGWVGDDHPADHIFLHLLGRNRTVPAAFNLRWKSQSDLPSQSMRSSWEQFFLCCAKSVSHYDRSRRSAELLRDWINCTHSIFCVNFTILC
jgi:hypothetical protein